MRDTLDDRVKERLPLKNGIIIVKLEVDGGVGDYDKAELVKTMPYHFGSFFYLKEIG